MDRPAEGLRNLHSRARRLPKHGCDFAPNGEVGIAQAQALRVDNRIGMRVRRGQGPVGAHPHGWIGFAREAADDHRDESRPPRDVHGMHRLKADASLRIAKGRFQRPIPLGCAGDRQHEQGTSPDMIGLPSNQAQGRRDRR
ncbi:hypothetical protein [Aquisphaera insulae]|uniref:hypothetical protein n=1 Tax=Aquisphaera insulae TaxID=2712864 RepID=UPI00202E395A|nr:hypothetical protein [Aquisphaera insulae]